MTVRPAQLIEVGAVRDLLCDAASWITERHGIAQWPSRFELEMLERSVHAGELYLAVIADLVVGSVSLSVGDPTFWGERCDALFVHRLVVARASAGCGSDIIDWAAGRASDLGLSFLCLDVLSENLRLRRYYEDLDFMRVGEVSGISTTDRGETREWRTTLYERSC